jgi:multisubunit Na+/H+ antiporter MnhE subunit
MSARSPTDSIVIWCLALGTYLLFAATISVSELLAGFIVAALAALWAHVIHASSVRRFSPAREQIAAVLRALAAIFPATVRTSAVLSKVAICGGAPGRSMRSRFRIGFGEDPGQRTRRALIVLCASLAPNRFVVDVERGRGEALMHAIDRLGGEPDPEWLR